MAPPERHRHRLFGGVGAAFVFLTRLPVPGWPYSRREFAQAPAHFPLVGAVLGSVLGLAMWILLPGGALGAAFLALGVGMLLTGCLHEDGLADTVDSLGGSYDRARLFEILKDSRIGSFAGAALVVSIGSKAGFLSALGPACLWAFPAVWCFSRVTPVWIMAAMEYATPTGSRSRDLAQCGYRHAIAATLWALLVGLLLASATSVDAVALAAAATAIGLGALICAWVFDRRAGGFTGDFLGAVEQVGEVLGFAAIAVVLAATPQ